MVEMESIEEIRPRAVVVMKANGRTFYPHLEDNQSANEFFNILNKGPVKVVFDGREGPVRAGMLSFVLPHEDNQSEASLGEIILRNGNRIGICIDTLSAVFTKIARIENPLDKGLLDIIQDDVIEAEFSLEWSE